MRKTIIVAVVLTSVVAACATGPAVEDGGMSPEEMMRHCQMMDAHHNDSATAHTDHDPARHGGMSHEDMMRHCAELRAGEGAPQR